jgi:uncharacterized protein YjeT (DUF2065 family)
MWVEGLVVMVVGFIYILCPHLFQQVLWRRIPVQHRLLTPEQNEQYMRGLGVVCVAAGLIMSVLPAGYFHL